jgi:hypothetical protein
MILGINIFRLKSVRVFVFCAQNVLLSSFSRLNLLNQLDARSLLGGRFCSNCHYHCPTELPAIRGPEVARVVAPSTDGVAT